VSFFMSSKINVSMEGYFPFSRKPSRIPKLRK
jgi:hypothetical protein